MWAWPFLGEMRKSLARRRRWTAESLMGVVSLLTECRVSLILRWQVVSHSTQVERISCEGRVGRVSIMIADAKVSLRSVRKLERAVRRLMATVESAPEVEPQGMGRASSKYPHVSQVWTRSLENERIFRDKRWCLTFCWIDRGK